ncbi:MAG: 1-phosphofructokinase family hexose kinase [Bacilli bacterium]|jgi:1-phosphofructokinase
MIYSLTIAPSIDYTLYMGEGEIRLGWTNRPISKGFTLGGKGVTVSRMLSNLKVDSIPIVAIGGNIGEGIKKMTDGYFKKVIYLPTKTESRLDVMITGTRIDTRFDPPAPKVTEEGLEKLKTYLKKNLKKGDVLILSGSLGQDDKDLYADLMRDYCEPVGATVFLDTVNVSLIDALPFHPYMIKPNQEELADILKKDINTTEDILAGGEELKSKGPHSVMVTLGSHGAYYFAENGHIYHCSNATGKQISPVGAGDSSIAGFIKGYTEGKSMEEILQYSMAAGGATAFSEGLGDYDLWKSLIPQIKVTLVK